MTRRKWMLVGANILLIIVILILWKIFVAPWNALTRLAEHPADRSTQLYTEGIANAWTAQRDDEVRMILSALDAYQMEHDGGIPLRSTSEFTEICTETAKESHCPSSMMDISFLLEGEYLEYIPRDPAASIDGIHSGYAVRFPLPEEGIGTVEVTSLLAAGE